MKKSISTISLVVLAGLTLLTGCTEKEGIKSNSSTSTKIEQSATVEQTQKKTSTYPMTIKDDAGRTVVLEKKPEKIAAISGTFLGILYAAGGSSIARSDATEGTPLPEAAKDLPTLGPAVNINLEKLVAMQPDFVIASLGTHDKYTAILEANKIPVIVLKMKTYDDVLEKLKLFGEVLQNQEGTNTLVELMQKRTQEIVSKLPSTSKKVLILYATSGDVSVKLENSIAGNVAQILKLNNIAVGSKPDKTGSENTPFSMEKIVESDPDVILVTTMVSSKDQAEQRIKKDLESNPVWSGLRAVKEKKVIYLPQSHFLYNPAERFYESIEYMAKAVYPEVYGNVGN